MATIITPEEVKRVKGLGCLQDKRQPEYFNVRVITVNGKITSAQHKVIAEAAEKFGSGEITMTTRLTLEIQGVHHDNIEPLREYLGQYGLETGGTGAKVRPVVSCKGTTCQYGNIDTFGLSEKIHEIFYKGYHDVVLPHKFKISVGGCPNNFAKPDLNDFGIVGAKLIKYDLDKCRGCKVCQIEKNCPIHICKVENGKLLVDPENCNKCGRCYKKCPFGVCDDYVTGYKIYVGGRWGKRIALGKCLSKVLLSEDDVIKALHNTIALFKDEGIAGERLSDTIDRLGLEYCDKKILAGI